MSNDGNSQAAWIPIPSADELSAEVAEIGDVSRKMGFVPNLFRVLGVSPRHLVGWWRYFDDLMMGPSNLTKIQREMIAVVVSAEARCPY